MKRSLTSVLVVMLLVCWAPASPAEKPAAKPEGEVSPYVFTVNGKPFGPPVISLSGDPEHPRPGDLVGVDRLWLALGEERECHFLTTPREDGRLLLKAADGTKRVIGASVTWTYKGDTKIAFNPLAKLSPEQLRGLWGIRLDGWPQGIEKKLAHLDPARACITVTSNTAQGKAKRFPPLPAGVRYLRLGESSSDGIEDFRPIARHKSLSVLTISTMSQTPLDLRLIEGNKQLEYLDLTGNRVENTGALATLGGLRFLDLNWCKGVEDVRFAAGLHRLRRLNLSRTGVGDLSPLDGLEALEVVNAQMTPVAQLPQGKLPALRRLVLFSTPVSKEAVQAFARAHPECKVLDGWAAGFREAVAGTTRVRVRSGGTCHRRIDREKTLAEVTGAAEIREFVEGIGIDEKRSGGHCMCCGDPSFEFYRGKELIATLGFHHGQSVRWPGEWPGDGMLTAASAEFLVRWLDARGVHEPLAAWEKIRRQEASARRRMLRLTTLLPPEVLSGLQKARSAEDAVKAFEQGVKDPVDRAVLFLRLYGCDNGTWNHYNALDKPLSEMFLPGVAKATLSAAVAKAPKDPAAANGAARWIFSDRKVDSIDGKTLAAVLPELAKAGLTHPRQRNRRDTIAALGRLKTPQAIGLLRGCLGAKTRVRPLPEDEQEEPGGMVVFRPGGTTLGEEVSDGAYAAEVLSKLGDRQSLKNIAALAGKAEGQEKKVLEEAVRRLEKDKAE